MAICPCKKKRKKKKKANGLLSALPAVQGRWSFSSVLHWRDTYEVSQNNFKLSLILSDSIFYFPGYSWLLPNIFSSTYGQKAFGSLPNLLKFEFLFQYIFFLVQTWKWEEEAYPTRQPSPFLFLIYHMTCFVSWSSVCLEGIGSILCFICSPN